MGSRRTPNKARSRSAEKTHRRCGRSLSLCFGAFPSPIRQIPLWETPSSRFSHRHLNSLPRNNVVEKYALLCRLVASCVSPSDLVCGKAQATTARLLGLAPRVAGMMGSYAKISRSRLVFIFSGVPHWEFGP